MLESIVIHNIVKGNQTIDVTAGVVQSASTLSITSRWTADIKII